MSDENILLGMCHFGKYDTDKFLGSKIGFPRSRPQNQHCYIEECYGLIFPRIKDSAKQVLEIGIDFGGSLLLWRDYFLNAEVTGVDIDITLCAEILGQERINIIASDAYSESFVNSLPNNYYDMIMDDGPHTYESMVKFMELYPNKLTDNGILILEDIPDIQWISSLMSCIPQNLRKFTKVYDYRSKYGRFDDMLIVIDKGVLVNG